MILKIEMQGWAGTALVVTAYVPKHAGECERHLMIYGMQDCHVTRKTKADGLPKMMTLRKV